MTTSLSEDAIAHKCTCSEPLTYTVEEAARLLGLGRRQAYSAVAKGELPSIKVGGRILISRQRLLELLNGGGPDAA